MLIILTLATTCHSWANTFNYKYHGCTLLYKKIDEYNIEITKQNPSLNNEKIHIPAEVQHNDTIFYVIGISDNAFSGNKHIKNVIFDPACDIQYIGEGAFSGCKNLTDIELPSTITEIKSYTFAWSGLKFIEIHNFITKIGERAFSNCTNLTTIEMSENIEEIGNYAFAWCTSLTSFTIPEKAKHLGYEILQANTNLDTLFFNAINCETSGAYYDNRVERTIGAFEYNNGLSEIIFGSRVERIPEYLLYNCHSIDSIYFPKSIKQIDRFALHNTEWFDGAKNDMIYVNNILYAYRGKKEIINSYDFKENTTIIASHCFYNNKNIKTINLPSDIHYIHNSAFEGCSNLTRINLPYNLEHLGDYVFKDCTNLNQIQFNNLLESIGKYCFSNCKSLLHINLPLSLKTMGDGIFYNCENLEETNIPDSIKYIPAGTFSKCPNLEYVKIHNNINTIEEYAFAGCSRLDSISIPWNCTKIGSRAFSHCYNLSHFNLNAKSIRIDPLAFYECENLYYIDLLGANRIGYKAFANCHNLNYVTLGNDLTTIANQAFENCTLLYSIEIPQSVTKIGKRAFSGCIKLSTLKINNAKTTIGDYAFYNCYQLADVTLGYNITELGNAAFKNCYNITEIELKHPLDKINSSCFANCKKLQTIILPQGIEKLESQVFYNCEELKNIDIPNTITFIGEEAFYGCNNLNFVSIPPSTKKIEKNAFKKCFNLNNIEFNAEKCYAGKPIFEYANNTTNLTIGNTVQLIDDYIFNGINITKIEIPTSVTSIGKYAFANSTPLTDITILSNNDIKVDDSAFDNTSWINNQHNNIIYIDHIALKYIGNDQPQEITFDEGTIAIAANFMANNIQLKKINLPSSIQTIGPKAFYGCTNITNVNFPNNLNSIYEYAFAGCSNLKYINIPTSISKIGISAFENCTQIDSINLNNAYCSINASAFRNCNKMTKAILGENITYIGNMAFAFCSSLKNINSNDKINLPSKIKIINTASFYNCTQLKGKIIIPKEVEIINDMAFEGCRFIHSIELSPKLQSINISAFNKTPNFTRFIGTSNDKYNTHNGILYSKNMNTLYHCPQGIHGTCVVHRETKIINDYAFNGCNKLLHIILNGVEEIKDFAFNGCTNIRKITLGENLNSINHKVFEGCQSLEYISIKKDNIHYKSVDGVIYTADMKTLILCPCAKKGKFKIPKSVQHIADYAFYNCNQISQIITHKNIKTIGKEAFTGCKTNINNL